MDEYILLKTIIDNSDMLIIVLDEEGRVRRFTQTCEQLSGYRFEQVEGQYLWDCDFVQGRTSSDCVSNFHAVKAATHYQPTKRLEYWLSRNGERILIEWSTVPIRNDEGKLKYLVILGTDVTEQQSIKNALFDREAESNALFEQAAVGIAYVAADGRTIDVNWRLCEIVGYRYEELLKTTFREITHPEDRLISQDYMEKTLNNEIQTYSIEKRYIRADGSSKWVNQTVSLVRDTGGEPNYFIALVWDIDQRKQTETLLLNSERQLREAQRITHIGSWELDLSNNSLHWSDEIYRIFEIDPDQFGASYEAFLETIHPEDRERVNNAYSRSLEEQTPYEISHRLLMADGRVKWVNERCESSFAADGTPLQSLGTVQDITEQMRIELELRELNQSLEQRVSKRTSELASERNFISTILDTVNTLIVVLDRQGRMVSMNRACEELTGYRQAELQGRIPWEVLVTEEQRESVQQVFNTLLAGGGTGNYELDWVSRDGSQRTIAWSNSILKNLKGEVEYIIESGVDITERIAAEEEIKRARDKAEQASHAKSEFLSRMSHELRTPLNAILGFSQLLETDKGSPLNRIQLENVNEILQAGNHLLDLINDILDMSRVEAGQLSLNMQAVALIPLLKECIALIQNQASQRSIQVQLDATGREGWQVQVDAMRLKQVILNLLSNAIKYNHDRGRVDVACSVQTNGQIRIAIRDTGDGLSTEQQAILFAPFERLDADIRAIPGTGIGLALSKRLTELMGGSIGVESEIGKGSTFWVQLHAAVFSD